MCGVNRCPRHAASWGEVDESGAGVQPSGGKTGDGPGRSGSPPVSRVLLCANAPATIHLGDVLPRRSSSLPGSDASRVMASLFGLAPDGVLHAVHVAAHAVGSYPALPPARRRTISTLPVPCGHRRFSLCCTYPSGFPNLAFASVLLCEVPTFLIQKTGCDHLDISPSLKSLRRGFSQALNNCHSLVMSVLKVTVTTR